MGKTTYKTMLRKICILGGAGVLLTGATSNCQLGGLLGGGGAQGQGSTDTDGDGWSDAQELAAGTDSFDPASHPH